MCRHIKSKGVVWIFYVQWLGNESSIHVSWIFYKGGECFKQCFCVVCVLSYEICVCVEAMLKWVACSVIVHEASNSPHTCSARIGSSWVWWVELEAELHVQQLVGNWIEPSSK